jgi:hypothetical protein
MLIVDCWWWIAEVRGDTGSLTTINIQQSTFHNQQSIDGF